jgi:hypothetical protein
MGSEIANTMRRVTYLDKVLATATKANIDVIVYDY